MEFRLDPDDLLSHKIILDKLDAARRQLESAVRMFFYDLDVVSQHTLISAAHGILYDLAKKRGIEGSIKDVRDSPLIRPDEKKLAMKAIYLPQNFFKHAHHDGGAKLVFHYGLSQMYLFDALRLFILLGGRLTYLLKVFLMWFQLRYPDLLCFESGEEDLRMIREGANNPEVFKTLARALIERRASKG